MLMLDRCLDTVVYIIVGVCDTDNISLLRNTRLAQCYFFVSKKHARLLDGLLDTSLVVPL